MKTFILLIASALVLSSCSKSKDDVATPVVTFSAGALSYQAENNSYYWKVLLNANKPVTATGSVVIEWDVYSGSSFIERKQASFSFTKLPATTFQYETGVLSYSGYSSRNAVIVSLNTTVEGYEVDY